MLTGPVAEQLLNADHRKECGRKKWRLSIAWFSEDGTRIEMTGREHE